AGFGSAPRVRARVATDAGPRAARSVAAASRTAPTGGRRVGTGGARTPSALSGPTRQVVPVPLFGGLAPGGHRAKPANGSRGAPPAPSQAGAMGSVSPGGRMIAKVEARFRPDVGAYSEETGLHVAGLRSTMAHP